MKNTEFIKLLKSVNYNGNKLESGLIVDGSLYLSHTKITSIPNNLTVGGSLYLSYTKITSLPDNLTVGGSLNLRGTIFYGEDIKYNKLNDRTITDKYIYVDDILTVYNKVKKHKEYTIYITPFKNTSRAYVITNGKHYAHCKEIKQGILDIKFKEAERDLSKYRDLGLDHKMSYENAIIMYRVITGACSGGIQNFLDTHNLSQQKKYSVREVIELTKGQYGNVQLQEYFGL